MVALTYSDILEALQETGVTQGDTVFAHSNIAQFGKIEGVTTKSEYAQIFIDAFMKIIGKSGTLCVPTFTYSFCKGENYDVNTTPSSMGLFAEHVRTQNNSHRSLDANFSVTAIGKRAESLTAHASQYSFGSDSFWGRLLECEGKFCNLNHSVMGTFIHYIERENKVEYRHDKDFFGQSKIDGLWQDAVYTHFVRDLDKPRLETNWDRINQRGREEGFLHTTPLGRGQIFSFSAAESFSSISNWIQENPYYLTCKNNVT